MRGDLTAENASYYAVIPAEVRYDKGLNANAKLLYGELTCLCNKTGYCWAKNEYFATLYGLSERTVSRMISQLEARGYIRCEMVLSKGGSERHIYTGSFPAGQEGRQNCPEGVDSAVQGRQNCPGGVDKSVQGGVDKTVYHNNKTENTKLNTPYSPPEGDSAAELTEREREFSPETEPYAESAPYAGAEEYSEPEAYARPETRSEPAPPSGQKSGPPSGRKSASHGPGSRKPKTVPAYHPDWFERFWGLYPRRTNRVAAVRAWDKLRPDFALCRVMSGAIRAQKQSAQWQDPEHIPHPATWLNGARWLDEMAGSPSDGEPEFEVRNGLR